LGVLLLHRAAEFITLGTLDLQERYLLHGTVQRVFIFGVCGLLFLFVFPVLAPSNRAGQPLNLAVRFLGHSQKLL
jgi:hypothetical protein